MDDANVAPLVGIVGSLAVVAVLALPLGVASVSAVRAYYASGAITPLAAGLLALVNVIVLAAGRQGRSDPALTAGAAIVLGAFVAVISLAWAFTVRPDVLGANVAAFSYHRWALVAAALPLPVAGGWYARALGLV